MSYHSSQASQAGDCTVHPLPALRAHEILVWPGYAAACYGLLSPLLSEDSLNPNMCKISQGLGVPLAVMLLGYVLAPGTSAKRFLHIEPFLATSWIFPSGYPRSLIAPSAYQYNQKPLLFATCPAALQIHTPPNIKLGSAMLTIILQCLEPTPANRLVTSAQSSTAQLAHYPLS